MKALRDITAICCEALQQRLPLQLKAENYSTNEKIAYINPELDPGQGNYEEKPEAGTLALFSIARVEVV
ncbi:MAG: cyclophilin-like fold protein [Succinivibrio sp.]|nr:cyclophilin-like fold protein [Succinivibrio sp.]